MQRCPVQPRLRFRGFLLALHNCSPVRLSRLQTTAFRRTFAPAPLRLLVRKEASAQHQRYRPIRHLHSSPKRVRFLFCPLRSLRLKAHPLLHSAALCPAKRVSRRFHPRCSRTFHNRDWQARRSRPHRPFPALSAGSTLLRFPRSPFLKTHGRCFRILRRCPALCQPISLRALPIPSQLRLIGLRRSCPVP